MTMVVKSQACQSGIMMIEGPYESLEQEIQYKDNS